MVRATRAWAISSYTLQDFNTNALAHGFNWQVVEDSIGLVSCSWVSWWGGQLERREKSCFWGLHASFVLSSMVTIGGDLQPGCLAEKKREQSAEKQKRG